MACTINDTSVPVHARMHCYDISRYKETGRLRCPCGHEVAPPVYMLGAEVHHYPGDDDDPAGYVAFARLSDGTLSFPMGSTVRATPEEAGLDCARVRYKDGLVHIEQEVQ